MHSDITFREDRIKLDINIHSRGKILQVGFILGILELWASKWDDVLLWFGEASRSPRGPGCCCLPVWFKILVYQGPLRYIPDSSIPYSSLFLSTAGNLGLGEGLEWQSAGEAHGQPPPRTDSQSGDCLGRIMGMPWDLHFPGLWVRGCSLLMQGWGGDVEGPLEFSGVLSFR